MADHSLRVVAGRDFNPRAIHQVQTEGEPAAGWPLSPTLLAALHRATPEMRRLCENMARINLGLPQLPQL